MGYFLSLKIDPIMIICSYALHRLLVGADPHKYHPDALVPDKKAPVLERGNVAAVMWGKNDLTLTKFQWVWLKFSLTG